MATKKKIAKKASPKAKNAGGKIQKKAVKAKSKSSKSTNKVKKVSKSIVKKKPVKKAVVKKVATKKPLPKKAVTKKPIAKKTAVKKAVSKKVVAKAKPKSAASVQVKSKAPVKKVVPKKREVPQKAKVAPKVVVKAAPVVVSKPSPKAPLSVKPGQAEKKITAPAVSAVVSEKENKKAQKLEAKKKAAIFKQVGATFNPLVNKPFPIQKPITIPKPTAPIMDTKPKGKKGKPEKTRYTDAELEEFKAIINNKMKIAREDYDYYMEQLKDQGEDTDHKYNPEEGGATTDKEQLNLMASRMIKYLNNLEAALIRIENKTYGICKDTGSLIPKARLIAVPHATQIIEAKNKN